MNLQIHEWSWAKLDREQLRLDWAGGVDAHIQLAALPDSTIAYDWLLGHLPNEEIGRLHRYRMAADQLRFLVGRGLLRAFLSAYYDREPREIAIVQGTHGKPEYSPPAGQARLQFNVSHSGNLVALAFTTAGEIGIDLESEDRLKNWEELVPQIFSMREQAELFSLPLELRRKVFLNGWTRKEAVLKAFGLGLINDMHALEVTLVPNIPARVLAFADKPDAVNTLALCELPLPHGYVGAVARWLDP